jgi:hypothetical protein
MPDAKRIDPIKKNEILKQYKNGGFMVNVVSIEPEGGPVVGNTRVLVRGGPFQDMQIFFPKPKCRFGRMDQVVDAQYVTCKSLPSAYTKEGKSQDRVSSFSYLFTKNFRMTIACNVKMLHL